MNADFDSVQCGLPPFSALVKISFQLLNVLHHQDNKTSHTDVRNLKHSVHFLVSCLYFLQTIPQIEDLLSTASVFMCFTFVPHCFGKEQNPMLAAKTIQNDGVT